MVITQVIDYQQNYYHPIRGEGEPPCNYYDPHVMLAEKTYKIHPNEEILIVISSSGYKYCDDTVFTLVMDSSSSNDSSLSPTLFPSPAAADQVYKPVVTSSSQLCVLVKNCSSDYSIYVGYKSPLKWLLDMPRVMARLCYCPTADLTKCRLAATEKRQQQQKSPDSCQRRAVAHNDDDDDGSMNNVMFQSAPHEMIVIGL